jgi:hypothetical protein
MPVSLLSLSDIHGKVSVLNTILEKVQGTRRPDIIAISGDISDFGNGDEVKRVLRAVEAVGIPFCYVLGNCDPVEYRMGVDVNGTCLESNCLISNGLVLTGAGGATPTPFDTPFEVEESELVAKIAGNRSACQRMGCNAPLIMVLHNPPRGEVVDRTRTGLHVGSQKLRDLILETSPLLVQCGHIHEARGTERIGTTTIFNPGPAQRGSYALVEIETVEGGSVNVVHETV